VTRLDSTLPPLPSLPRPIGLFFCSVGAQAGAAYLPFFSYFPCTPLGLGSLVLVLFLLLLMANRKCLWLFSNCSRGDNADLSSQFDSLSNTDVYRSPFSLQVRYLRLPEVFRSLGHVSFLPHCSSPGRNLLTILPLFFWSAHLAIVNALVKFNPGWY